MSTTEIKGRLHTISNVERDTGIAKDTLRIWERRYGFPSPERNNKGERLYPDEQVKRLITIRKLLDHGMRPNKVVTLDTAKLEALASNYLGACLESEIPADLEALLIAVRACDLDRLEELLHRQLALRGLEACVTEVISPLMEWIGDLWAADRMEIYEEHLLTRQVYRFLDLAISRTNLENRSKPVILATLPGEQHGIGLLMTEAMLLTRGIPSLNLGTQIPIPQIVLVAGKAEARAVGLSFSASFPQRKIRPLLRELLEATPESLELLVGGAGILQIKRAPERTRLIRSFDELQMMGE
ncbi:MAG: MerR family transcriptional regulator [Chromatiales bacterium]|jgi:DNA-binding transcriptional MerR regulator/methylmalonyl-CoA mutase cobalamin-binding subunit